MAQCKDCIHEKVCLALIKHGLPWNDGKYLAEKLCFEFLNKADVVPKSEVDKLHEVIFMKEDLMQSIAKERNYYYDELQKAKQEVAREIFEEIESNFYYDDVGDYVIDHMDYQKLQKKYTESEGKGCL